MLSGSLLPIIKNVNVAYEADERRRWESDWEKQRERELQNERERGMEKEPEQGQKDNADEEREKGMEKEAEQAQKENVDAVKRKRRAPRKFVIKVARVEVCGTSWTVTGDDDDAGGGASGSAGDDDGGGGGDGGGDGGGGSDGDGDGEVVALPVPESALARSTLANIAADAEAVLENFIGLIIESEKIDQVR